MKNSKMTKAHKIILDVLMPIEKKWKSTYKSELSLEDDPELCISKNSKNECVRNVILKKKKIKS